MVAIVTSNCQSNHRHLKRDLVGLLRRLDFEASSPIVHVPCHVDLGIVGSILVLIIITATSSDAFYRPAVIFLRGTQVMSSTKLAQSTISIPPPPAISLPVWSLAASTTAAKTLGSDQTTTTSMNIVTYAIPVSVAPPKLWMVSLYHGTLTKKSFLSAGGGVLQLLSPSQKDLIFLGKQSGFDTSKSKTDECTARGYPWTRDHPFGDNVSLLPDCVSYIQVQVKGVMEAGDHVAVLCEVIQTGTWDDVNGRIIVSSHDGVVALDQSTVLYSGQLREEGLI